MPVDLLDPRVLAGGERQGLAADGVPHQIAPFVLLGPLTVRSGQVLAREQHADAMVPLIHLTD